MAITSRTSRLPLRTVGALSLLATVLFLFPGLSFAADEGGDGESGASSASTAKYGDEKIDVDILADQLKLAEADNVSASMRACAMRFRLDFIAARLPEQQQRGERAARNLYKNQKSSYGMVEMLLSSQSFDDFVRQADYLRAATESNLHEIQLAHSLREESETRQAALEASREEASARLEAARETLEEAQAKRIEKAAVGIASAIGIAGSMGGKQSLSIGPTREEESGASKGSAGSEGAKEDPKAVFDPVDSGKSATKSEPKVEATTDTSALDDGADWSMSKEEFVAQWAPRLNAYLEGSALAGQGENFAKCAWKYCIDPRWSAAISNTESSKGAICIRPHNAWGWGAADSDPYNLASEWGSWEEAIDAHARGLAEGYGYTISMSAALTYCPYNWQSWYNNTLAEMAQI